MRIYPFVRDVFVCFSTFGRFVRSGLFGEDMGGSGVEGVFDIWVRMIRVG